MNKAKIHLQGEASYLLHLKMNMYDKAINSGVDIVCLELEDGIAPTDKVSARKNALEIINKKKTQ